MRVEKENMKENKGRHSDRFIDIDTDKRKKNVYLK